MVLNTSVSLTKRCPTTARLVLLPLALLGILGFFINTHILFLTASLDICSPKNNIVFLKTHKCAGSSIQNILMRYGDIHDLTFVLPKDDNYLGHPTPFNKSMVAHPQLHKYNILAHHTRLDYYEIKALMPSNTVYITILRDPVKVFESSYSYFELDKSLGGDIHKFLAKVPSMSSSDLHKRYQEKFGSNQMMFDLGADPTVFTNETAVKQYIEKLDSWFHLVLIADRMEESLVLLRHFLCWNLDDVVAFKLNARDPKFKSNLSEKEKKSLKRLNQADVSLYNHFLERFEKAVDRFGRDRMASEIEKLRERTQKWYKMCIKGQHQRHEDHTDNPTYYLNPKALVFETNNESNSTCQLMTIEELHYTDILRKKQMTRLTRLFISAKLHRRNGIRLRYKNNKLL